ncbi:Sine oculis-binding protein -like protein [Collichthys lucidus]|uniref:Sine oculis-binding protein-like protein n=1 Tax=Collichthys lucidus TaxID=240159 RepID=A0A4V6ARY7_COLLU|nr:Sine oculis-binding protein -like protein [Collichthys lucidus]
MFQRTPLPLSRFFPSLNLSFDSQRRLTTGAQTVEDNGQKMADLAGDRKPSAASPASHGPLKSCKTSAVWRLLSGATVPTYRLAQWMRHPFTATILRISRKVEGNESRGEGEAEEEREREQGSGKVEKEEEEAKGNLACGFGNVITVYSDLLWFLPARQLFVLQSFAENTMNELLGWYGYDKVELRDSDNLEIGETPQHISVLKENLLPKIPPSTESGEGSPDRANSSQSLPASRNGVTEPSTTPSTSTPSTKEHGNLPIIVPMIPPPLIKPPAGGWYAPAEVASRLGITQEESPVGPA